MAVLDRRRSNTSMCRSFSTTGTASECSTRHSRGRSLRAARIWAPLKLPVDRIVVGAGFPAEGRADIYEAFVGLVREGITASGDPPPTRLVVISLGLRGGERDLEPSEVSGALAVQIQRLVNDLHSKHRAVTTPAVEAGPATP